MTGQTATGQSPVPVPSLVSTRLIHIHGASNQHQILPIRVLCPGPTFRNRARSDNFVSTL